MIGLKLLKLSNMQLTHLIIIFKGLEDGKNKFFFGNIFCAIKNCQKLLRFLPNNPSHKKQLYNSLMKSFQIVIIETIINIKGEKP